MINMWGYSMMSFFVSMSRFGIKGAFAARAFREFKEMVKVLYVVGI